MKGQESAFNLGVTDNRDMLTLDTVAPGAEKLVLKGTGGFIGGNFIAASDKNLKTNINFFENSLENVQYMNGVFNWKETNNKSIGVIAQEMRNRLWIISFQ